MALERHAGRLWVASGGGPLLVLERRLLPAWGGLETGDYDRACATTSEVEDIAVGDGRGLILGDEPAMTTAVERADGVAFVRWHAADDVHTVERAILQLQKTAMLEGRPAGITFDLMDRELVVFDSVEPGLEQSRFSLPERRKLGEGSLRVPIAPGTYWIHLGELDPAVGSLSIVQLVHEPS